VLTDCGGGSGGRIAIYINENYNFHGHLEAVGGSGGDAGAAGTVFIEATVGVSKHRQLHVDGANFGDEITCSHPAVVTSNYTFSEMTLKRRGCLFIAKVCYRLSKIHLINEQLWYIKNKTSSSCNKQIIK